jgi:hypothetical protein
MAVNAATAMIQDVRVDHCGAPIVVPYEFLHGSNVIAILKQLRRKRMAKRVRACRLGYSGLQHGLSCRLLQYRLMKMVPDDLPGFRIDIVL